MIKFWLDRLSVLAWVASFAFCFSLFAEHPRLCGLSKVPRHPAVSTWTHALANLPSADTQSEPTVIDAMFLYTADTIVGAGSEAVLRRKLQDAIDEANYVYTNSEVNISINPVYMG